jgi:hypothetical protein
VEHAFKSVVSLLAWFWRHEDSRHSFPALQASLKKRQKG